MKISNASIDLTSSHRSLRTHEVQERMNLRLGPARPPAAARRPPPGAGEVAGATRPHPPHGRHASSASGSDTRCETGRDTEPHDLGTSILKALTEMLTGRRVETFDPRELEHQSRDAEGDAPPRPPQPAPQPAGFSLEYDRVERTEESESVAFSASGRVTTQDGREIRFELKLELARSFVAESKFSLRAGDAVMEDPLVLNFDGRGASLESARIEFDINADGHAESIARLAAGSGFLVLDSNGNGQADDGSELFGARTGDGFAELARFDDDGNGWIDEADAVYRQLSVWQPGSGLQSLAAVGVGALHLGATATPFALKDSANQALGALRSSGIYLSEDGRAGLLQQVDLAV